MVFLLDEIAERMLKLEKTLPVRPEGVMEPLTPVHVTATAKVIHLRKKWFSLCLSGDSSVSLNDGLRRIDEINVGDMVHTYENGLIVKRKVTAKTANENKQLYNMRTNTRSIHASLNHPFLVYDRRKGLAPLKIVICPECYKEIRTKATNGQTKCTCGKGIIVDKQKAQNYSKRFREGERKKAKLIWKSLEQIRVGDHIVILKQLPEEHEFVVNTTPEEMQVFGLFLGDGFLRLRSRNRGEITFCVYPSQPIFEKYSRLLQTCSECKVYGDKRGMHIYSHKIAQRFDQLGFNKRAKNKEIPHWVFGTPDNYKLALLRGYLDSDGTVNKEGRAVFVSASEKLIIQMRYLAITLGLHVSNIYKRIMGDQTIDNNCGKQYKYNGMISWSFELTGNIGSENPSHIERLNLREQKPRHNRNTYGHLSVDLPKYLALERVKSIEKAAISTTYDICVENSHNFFANQILVHNSIVNDGPEDCWIIVNTEKSPPQPYLTRVGESYEADFGSAVIEDIRAYTDSGSANLRIRGIR